MRILVSNDDGVHAPGLAVLAESLAPFAEIIVVAPDRDRSAASNSLTLDVPLRLKQQPTGFYAINGTPTDGVLIAIRGWLEKPPDMVVSGINSGANLGDDVLYSGTVAAAMEGRFLGFPAIAISLVTSPRAYSHYATAGKIASRLLKNLLHNPLPKDTILNVNVPNKPIEEIKGFQVTRLGHRHIAEEVIATQDPRNDPIYWIGPAGKEEDGGPGTDFYAISQGYVSITPLTIDLTDHRAIDPLAVWAKELSPTP